MNEQRVMLADTVERLFPVLSAQWAGSGSGCGLEAGLWQQVGELGLPELLLGEAAGGFGGNWQDAFVVMRAAGLHALPLPVGETIVARELLGDAWPGSDAPLTIARCRDASIRGERFGALLKCVAWGGGKAQLLTAACHEGVDYLVLLDPDDAGARQVRDGAPGEPRFDLRFDDAPVLALIPRDQACEQLLVRGALLRAAQMAGALEAALGMTISHVNDRVQFGRPLSKFQVIQHQLALLAEEVAAVTCAAQSACVALDAGHPELAVAAAKLRANRSVQQATSIAHQLHGAIGFTREHDLHRFSQRLWCWRPDFGNDRHWAACLGRLVTADATRDLWSRLSGVTAA